MQNNEKQTAHDKIDSFLSGNDEMERIIKIECGYNDDKVSIIYRNENGEKRIRKDFFNPFLWCTDEGAKLMFGGNREELKKNLVSYGIGCKALRISKDDGSVPERMHNGYRLMFYAKAPMTYNKFVKFFEKAGVPIWPDENDVNYNINCYIAVSPVEQYMIKTGKRMFKGYDNYDDLLRMEWDLETEGLDPEKDAISQIGIRTNKGFEKIITIEATETKSKEENELEAIREFFEIISDIKPDVISGHNTENFDWNFINVRLTRCGSSLMDFTKSILPNGVFKKKKQAVLKLGGEVEYYFPTVMWGFNLTDSLFAVRRAQAIDSNMKSATLKYATKYSNIAKVNRVYVPGKIINSTWEDMDCDYAFNDDNGRWFKFNSEYKDKTFIDEKTGETVLRYVKNNDGTLSDRKTVENFVFKTGRYIVQRYLLDDLWETDKVELRFNESNFLLGKMLPTSFEKTCTMGTAAIWKLLMLAWSYENGIGIPRGVQKERFVGALSRLLKVGFVDKIVKLDFNSLYPAITLTFGIATDVDITGVMPSLLNYMLTYREKYKDLKAFYGKKADELSKKLKETDDAEEIKKLKAEINEAKQLKLRNDKMQLPLKITANSYFGSFGAGGTIFPFSDFSCAEEITCTGRQMLRLMISHFKHIGYEPIVGDTDGFNFKMPDTFRYTDEHPYIGKGLGRNVKEGKEYTLVEADVAEFEDLYMNTAYNGGILKNGLGIDEYCTACIQFARKNYADLMPDGSIKLVGNTVKSKKMPKYIEKFLDKAIRMLLEGRGKDFVEYYYDYVEKIYNLQIPLSDIATVGKIKTSLKTYKENCQKLTSAGVKKSRQAWYELAIKNKLNVNMGDTIYYINTGDKKSSSDIKRITHYYAVIDGKEVEVTKDLEKRLKVYRENMPKGVRINKTEFAQKEYGRSLREEDEIIFNCVLLPNNIIEDEEEHFCNEDFEYNVDKYVEMFNKRITPLLVCFSPEMRSRINEKGKVVSNILISNPNDRKQFTEKECQLVSGKPFDAHSQDTYEQLMTMDDKEVAFWIKNDKNPPYAKEIGIDWDSVKQEYLERSAEMEREEIKTEIARYNDAISKITKNDVSEFIENGVVPSAIVKIAELDDNSNDFISIKHGVRLGDIFDIIDKDFVEDD